MPDETPPVTEAPPVKETLPPPTEIEYKLTLPTGSKIDPKMMIAEAKELGLTQEQAQKLADKRVAMIGDFEKSNKAKLDGWKDALKADKELGGDNLVQTIESRDRAVSKLIAKNPAIQEFLNTTGLIDNPVMVSILNEIGKMSADDTRKTGTNGTSPVKLSMNERLVNNYQKKG